MFRISGIAVNVVSAAFFLVPVLIVLQMFFSKGMSRKRKLLVILFAVYIGAVFSATGIPSVNSLVKDTGVNLIPLVDMVNSPLDYLKNTLLNIVLFMPLGILLPLLWKKSRSLKNTVLLGLGLSCFIEILQIFTFRLTDVDDLLTNAAGAAAGFILYKLLNRTSLFSRMDCSEEDRYGIKGMLMVTGIAFAVMFLAAPWVSEAIWLQIYK